jgi:hypothetical protein
VLLCVLHVLLLRSCDVGGVRVRGGGVAGVVRRRAAAARPRPTAAAAAAAAAARPAAWPAAAAKGRRRARRVARAKRHCAARPGHREGLELAVGRGGEVKLDGLALAQRAVPARGDVGLVDEDLLD